jgi:NADH dehydrogenase/NADH:ubiquinone oxidoreductase subunit G
MVTLTIDNKTVEIDDRATILEAARKVGIEIPTLCYHEALTPYGACRVCTVEIVRERGPQLAASCIFPVENNLIVHTNSETVLKARRLLVELLLARAPGAKNIQQLAEQLGINQPRFDKEDEDCILCGLCVRVCKEIVGLNAISLINRGKKKEVRPPFNVFSDVCVICGTCMTICPTGARKLEKLERDRIVHDQRDEARMWDCKVCADSSLKPLFLSDEEYQSLVPNS